VTNTKTAKSRTIAVRLISMALTGYYKTLVRPRQHRPLSMLKYDPVGTFLLDFLHSTSLRRREGEIEKAGKEEAKEEDTRWN
jgi:large subunit ribosomal protein L33